MEAEIPPNLSDKLPINTVSHPRTLKVSLLCFSYSVELVLTNKRIKYTSTGGKVVEQKWVQDFGGEVWSRTKTLNTYT